MPSKKKVFSQNYEHAPMLEVVMEIDTQNIVFNGLIDTGSTYTIIAEELATKYFAIDSSNPIEITGANGKTNIHLIGDKLISIPNYHRTNNGFKIPIYSSKNILSDKHNIEIILGLSFLEQCTSFWLDAANKTYVLEFFS
jgi:predicted aspartyl protease